MRSQTRDYADHSANAQAAKAVRNDRIEALVRQGLSDSIVSRRLGVSKTTVLTVRKALGLKPGSEAE